MEDITIIGGDLITVEVVKKMAKNRKVHVFALEYAEELRDNKNIIMEKTLQDAINASRIIMGPMPLTVRSNYISTVYSREKIRADELRNMLIDKIFIAGNIWDVTREQLEKQNSVCFDVFKSPELQILSTIITAEGVLSIAIQETKTTIHGANVLILGFGKTGKMLAKEFKAVKANVFVEARKKTDLAWIDALGYNKIDLKNLDDYLHKFDVIINTIPASILDNKKLSLLKKESILINLPILKETKIDIQEVNRLGIKYIWVSSLPQVVAPKTYADIIIKTVDSFLEEEKEK